ncbi:MAG: CAP domain-containing protein [Rikenellaceae bacterium]|nr:CAP domain-containing protein [Rikenellaceae bacterium]
MKKFFIASLLSLLFSVTAYAAYVTKVTITTAEPKVGEKFSFKASVPETASTEVCNVYWSGEFDNGKFVQGNDYTITIKLRIKASSSNIFATSSRINATVNGNKAQVTGSNDVNRAKESTITVKYTWKTLGGENPNNPKTKLKAKLSALAAEYKANNTTNDKDLLAYLNKKLPDAQIWFAGDAYRYTRRMPTDTNDGHVSMAIGITCDGVTLDKYYFTVSLPATNKSPEAVNLKADMERMKGALQDLLITSKTTGDDVLKAVNAASIHGTKAVWDKNYRYEAPTANIQGSIVGNIIVALGDKRDIICVHKVLPINGSAADAAIDADVSALSKALRTCGANNSTTEEELLSVANASMKNGTKLTLKSFAKTDATYDKEGKIVMDFELSLKNKTRTTHNVIRMAKLRAKLPFGISVVHDEWEILRLTNIERYKVGVVLLTMVDPLQDAARIRAKEIVKDYRYDHLRPDGSKFSTAIDPSFIKNRTSGENAFQGKLTPSQAIEGWMKSPGHRANILSAAYSYFGAGVHYVSGYKYLIQLFAAGGGIQQIESSTGSYTFKSVTEMEKAYLICQTGDGIKSYIPLEADYMVKNANQYTIHLKGKSVTVTVEGN